MRPILFEIPGLGLRVHSYGVFLFGACLSALAIAVWRSRREKVEPDAVYELATWLFLGGVVGGAGVLRHPAPGSVSSCRRLLPDLGGRQRLLRVHPGGPDGLDPLLVSPAVPVPADVRRDRAGGGDRRRGGTHRLLLERLLSWLGLPIAVGDPVPDRQPRVGPPAQRRPDSTRRRLLAADPPDPALLDGRGAAGPRDPAAVRARGHATSRRGHGVVDDLLPPDAMAHRGDPQRRAQCVPRHVVVAEHQCAASPGRRRPLVVLAARAGDAALDSPGSSRHIQSTGSRPDRPRPNATCVDPVGFCPAGCSAAPAGAAAGPSSPSAARFRRLACCAGGSGAKG